MNATRWASRARPLLAALLVASLAISFVVVPATAIPATAAPPAIGGLHVAGTQLANSAGAPVRLLGVNRSGTEYACIQGWGIFDGPSDAASVAAIASWQTNAVRLGLNEDCWLNINGVNPAVGGANYQQAIINYVNTLNSAGLAAVLELHWSAPGTTPATGQQPMPDRDHSVAFWQSVATTFGSNKSVLLDIFNEPYPDSNRDTTAAWTCWRDGGTSCPGVPYAAAGSQELVTAIRGTGATNVIAVAGVQYSNTLTQWLAYRPTDPQNNIVASWHTYKNTICVTVSCFDSSVAPVASAVPVLAGEIGQGDCQQDFVDLVMNWLDARSQSYLAWTWDTWGCTNGGQALISDYSGTPTQPYGQAVHDHLVALSAGAPTPTPTPSVSATPTASTTPTDTATPTLTPTPTSTPPTAVPSPTPTTGSVVSAYAPIQAETFSDKSAQPRLETTFDTEGGLDVGFAGDGDWLRFDNVDFGATPAARFIARLSSASGAPGQIEVHLDDLTNTAIGSLPVPLSGSWQHWQTASTPVVMSTTGVHTVFLKFTNPSAAYVANLNWFQFDAASGTPTATPTPTVATSTPTATSVVTGTATPTSTSSPTPTVSTVPTSTPTPTATVSTQPTSTPTPTASPTPPSGHNLPVPTPTPTLTSTPKPAAPTSTPTPAPLPTSTSTSTPTPTPPPTSTPPPTPTRTPGAHG